MKILKTIKNQLVESTHFLKNLGLNSSLLKPLRGVSAAIKLTIIFAILSSFAPLSLSQSSNAPGGIGLYLGEDANDSGRILVYTVTYKSPADKAKIKKGDELLAINGKLVKGKTLEQIAQEIAGPVGSSVSLSLSRNGSPQEIVLTRQALQARTPMTLPLPNQVESRGFWSESEKKLVKEKIQNLKTEADRQRMFELLSALKQKKITKAQFMEQLKQAFP